MIVQYGGQTPLKLARALEAAGAPIIGTSPDSIDIAEDRERFQQLVDKLELKQPPNAHRAQRGARPSRLAREVGFPLVVRPSYVLGGRAMEIVFNEDDLRDYMTRRRRGLERQPGAARPLPRRRDRGRRRRDRATARTCSIGGIMEHIEQAGVHSGDSGCSLPPISLSAGDAGRSCASRRASWRRRSTSSA